MRRANSGRAVMLLVGLIGVAWAAGLALAAPTPFTVQLTGAQQVPPVQTTGNGTANLTYDPATRVVTWSITYSGLSSPATMAHFHGPAEAGKNANVQVWLSKQGSPVESPIKGEATLTPEQAQQFTAGEMYINVHTRDHPAGEIRGQVTPPKG
jgi:CHRD domain